MKNTKKVLSVALAGALAFGSMGAAFAAAPVMDAKTDVKVTEAVKRLNALGLVAGMEDGKYHEEMKLTREQAAKLIVEALGLGSAAKAANGATQFKDVDASRWSAGYINVAAGQGLVKGLGDGNFGPDKEVSYAQVATMLVRALGYKDEFVKGAWPGNYVAKAADVKITNGASFTDPNGTADRGTVAVLLNNTLDAKIVKVDTYEGSMVKYTESQKTLLKDKLELSKYTDVRIDADKLVDNSLEKGKVNVKFTSDMDDEQKLNVKKAYTKTDSKNFELAKNVNVRDIIGQEATIYVDKNDKIVFAERENDDKAYFDYVEGFSGSKLSLVKADDDYAFASGAKIYLHDGKDKYTTATAADVAKMTGKVGKFVIKNKEIVYAEIMSNTEAQPWMLVKENKDGIVKGINGTDEKFSVNLSGKGNFDGVFVYDTEGNAMDVKDIAAGNIVYVQKQDYAGDDYALVTVVKNNELKGKLGKIKDKKVQIGDKEIKLVKHDGLFDQAYYSIDKDENSKVWTDADNAKDMEDADGAEVTAYLDAAGRIAYLTTEAKATSAYQYGVITKTYTEGEKVKVFTTNKDGKGEEITYSFEEVNNFNGTNNEGAIEVDKFGHKTTTKITRQLVAGDVVKFKLNKKGEVAENEMYVADKANFYTLSKDFGKDSMSSLFKGTTTVSTFSVDAKTTLIDAQGMTDHTDNTFDAGDFDTVKWSDLAEDNKITNEYFVFADDKNDVDAKAVVFCSTAGISSASDAEAVYVVEKWIKGGDKFVKIVNSKGEEKDIMLDNDSSYSTSQEAAHIAKIKSNGKIELDVTTDPAFGKVAGVITAKDGDMITVNANQYKLNDKTVVYEEDTKKSSSNIAKGDAVSFVVEDGVNVRVIERLIDDEAAAYIATGVAVGITSETTKGVAKVDAVTAQPQNAQFTVDMGIGVLNDGNIVVAGKLVPLTTAVKTTANLVTEINKVAAITTDWTVTAENLTTIKFVAKANAANKTIAINAVATGLVFGPQNNTQDGKTTVTAVTAVKEVGTTAITSTKAVADGIVKVNVADGTLNETVNVAVKKDDTAAVIATKIAEGLKANSAIKTAYDVTISTTDVVLTQVAGTEKDVTIAITIK